jgi:hypothetical protein
MTLAMLRTFGRTDIGADRIGDRRPLEPQRCGRSSHSRHRATPRSTSVSAIQLAEHRPRPGVDLEELRLSRDDGDAPAVTREDDMALHRQSVSPL